jgi:four helix bundle protein
MTRKYDLEDRLVDFSSRVIQLAESLPATKSANFIANQMIRCGVAPALLYGEAQGAESRDDFVHKMKIALKELKETRISLKIVSRNGMAENIVTLCSENEELIAGFAKSIETAKKNTRVNKTT